MRQRLGWLTTTKTWNESLADLRQEFQRWGIEDYLLPTKAESQKAKKVTVPFALQGTWVHPECGRFGDKAEHNLRAIVLAVEAARKMDQRGIGALLAEIARPLALRSGDLAPGPWEILGLRPEADHEMNRREFRRLIQQHHPDRGGDSDKFQEILAAGKECGLN